jgi:hypothetical protein
MLGRLHDHAQASGRASNSAAHVVEQPSWSYAAARYRVSGFANRFPRAPIWRLPQPVATRRAGSRAAWGRTAGNHAMRPGEGHAMTAQGKKKGIYLLGTPATS